MPARENAKPIIVIDMQPTFTTNTIADMLSVLASTHDGIFKHVDKHEPN